MDIREKMHFDLLDPIAFTRLATAAFNVKTETVRLVTAHARIGRGGKNFTDFIKNANVGRRIGSRRATNRILGDINDFIQLAQPVHGQPDRQHR